MFDSINFVTSSIFTWDLFVSSQHSENRNQQNTEFGPIFCVAKSYGSRWTCFLYSSINVSLSGRVIISPIDVKNKNELTRTAYRVWMRYWMCCPFADAIFSLSLSSYSNWSANCIVKWEAKRVFEYHTQSSITFLAGNVLTIDNDVDKYLLSFSPQVD